MAYEKQTGSAAIDYTFTPGIDCVITGIELHLNEAGGTSENFTMSKDDADNAVYDVNYITEDMETAKDIVNSDVHNFTAGDKLVFAYANTNNKIWGLKIFYEPKDYYYGRS